MDEVTAAKKRVYRERFKNYGATSQGVGWGNDAARGYRQMLDVIRPGDRRSTPPVTFLDVGCGFGGLLDFAHHEGFNLNYTGIDVISEMIEHGRLAHSGARFICGDFFSLPEVEKYDYVACNGLLTDRFEIENADFSAFVERVLRKAFALSAIGMAANFMTSKVTYREDHIFYMDPAELLSFCLDNLTRKVRLDHTYERYDYVIHAYRAEP